MFFFFLTPVYLEKVEVKRVIWASNLKRTADGKFVVEEKQ